MVPPKSDDGAPRGRGDPDAPARLLDPDGTRAYATLAGLETPLLWFDERTACSSPITTPAAFTGRCVTPAMEANLTNYVWTRAELLA